MNFHRGFHSYLWILGQENDPNESGRTRRRLDDYVNENYPEVWRNRVAQFLANTDHFQREEDWFPAQVVDQAVQWLERNRSHPRIFLWVDSFEPHEPWDPPARFDVYRDPNYRGKRLIMPMGGHYSDWATEQEARDIRGLYAGEAAFVDHCLGKLFAAIRELGYLEDSVVFIVADHGHPLGDHGKFLKGADRLYSELLKVPFMVRLPGGAHAGRRQAIVQFQDVLPTLLDIMGLGNNTLAMHGRSFKRVILGDSDEHRKAMIVGYHEGVDRCIRDRRWSLILRPEGEPDELYDLESDPREIRNLIDEAHQEAERLAGLFGSPYFRPGRATAAVKGIQGTYEVASGSVD